MGETRTGPKFYSRYSFSSVPVSSRNVKLRKRLGLAKMFPAGMGAIYSFEFSVGPSDNDNDQARLHYIGLSFSNPTLRRIEGHDEDTKADKRTLDYLAYAAAAYNDRSGAKNVPFKDMPEVMDVVSIFDLGLMERYYIELEKTKASGASTYESFDEMVNDRNFVNGKKFTTKKIGLNTVSGGQGDPLLQNALRSQETSRVVTPEDIIFGALAFIEDRSPDVLNMRSKFMPSELKKIPDDSVIKQKYNLAKGVNYETILPYKVHYIIENFAKVGAIQASLAADLKKVVQKSPQYKKVSSSEKTALIEEAKMRDKDFSEKYSVAGFFQSLLSEKERGKNNKEEIKGSYIYVDYIAQVLKISGYDERASYIYGDNPNYGIKFKNDNFAASYNQIYNTKEDKPELFKYFAQGFLALMFSKNPRVQDFLKEFNVQLSKADEQSTKGAIKQARNKVMEGQKSILPELARIEILQMVDDMSKNKNKNIKIDKTQLDGLKSKTIKEIAAAIDKVIDVLNDTLPGGLTNEERIFLHARIRNIAFAFNVGKITTN